METPLRELFPVTWFGEGTTDHPDPSNRSVSVRFAFSAEPALPTAHDSPADTRAVFVSSPPPASAPVARFSEPHVEASARLAPALISADGTGVSTSDVKPGRKTERRPPPPRSPLTVTVTPRPQHSITGACGLRGQSHPVTNG